MMDDATKVVMLCPRCDEKLEPGVLYCGNCGQAILQPADGDEQVTAPPPVAPDSSEQLPLTTLPPSQLPFIAPHGPPVASGQPLPRYARVDPLQQKTEPKAMLSVIVAVLSLPAALVPLLGVGFGVTALVLAGKVRRSMANKALPNVATAFAAIGIALSIGAYGYIASHQSRQIADGRVQPTNASDEPVLIEKSHSSDVVASAEAKKLDTPCYSVILPQVLQAVINTAASCITQAFDTETATTATNAVAISATRQADITAASFLGTAKDVAASYVSGNLPGFLLTDQHAASFAGSQAYYVSAQKSDGTTTNNVQLALVYHPTSHGENLFVIVQVVDNSQASLADFETSWVWK